MKYHHILLGLLVAGIALWVVTFENFERTIRSETTSVTLREDDIELLALNIYFHRGETNTDSGRKAITAVVFNRLDDREHYWGPKSIRGIITFRYRKGRKDCDFSWYCNGLDDTPGDPERYAHDRALAKKWLTEYRSGRFKDPTGGATWFIYRNTPLPRSWKQYDLKRAGTFGEYRFYKF